MSRVVTSTAVARRFLKTATKAGKPLTPLKLIKLSYLAHGWAYPILGYLLVDETVEAWQYGPVFPLLYDELKKHGREPVSMIPNTEREINMKKRGVDLKLMKKEKGLIDAVFKSYKDYNGSQLITLTHEDGGPWSLTRKMMFWDRKMEPDVICKHYSELADKKKKEKAYIQHEQSTS